MVNQPEPRDPRLRRLRFALDNGYPGGAPPEGDVSPAGVPGRVGDELEGRLQAAVSLVLRTSKELDILLIRRAEVEGDPWSGHMALPGGRREAGDPTLLHTAVRETAEETGVDLLGKGIHLGRMPEVRPEGRRLPLIAISPFVFAVPAEVSARVASPELDAVLWVPLDRLQDPETLDTLTLDHADGVREFPGFRVEEGLVWGLTYRILTRFMEICPFTTPP